MAQNRRLTVYLLLLSAMVLPSTYSSEIPKLKMNNGETVPAIALGTYLGFNQNGVLKSENKQLRDVIMHAIDMGYRHIDTAHIYDTEEEIGEGIRIKISEGVIKRDDMFVTTKLWNTHHRREQVPLALKQALGKMGLTYLDLYLIHWPIALNEDYSFSHVDFMETWRGMEDVLKLGLVKSIGVSNFNSTQLKRVIEEGSIKPVAIQIEVHPQIIQTELIEYAKSEGIVVLGYSPFGSLVMRNGMRFHGPKIDDPTLVEIAKKYNKTTPQVVLRWLVDRNVVPVPKSINLKRLKENIDIFDFKLEPHEIVQINKFNNNVRYTLPSFWQTHPYYPFENVDDPVPDPFVKKQ